MQDSTQRKRIRVNLTLQVVDAYEGEQRVHRFECTSGDAAHPTDRGIFHILRKRHPYRSHAYNVQTPVGTAVHVV